MQAPWVRVAEEGLALPAIAPLHTGRGVTVAVVDSGVQFRHPHLGLEARGVSILEVEEGGLVTEPRDFVDRYGHGTCIAALIHLLAPGAEIVAVRVSEGATTDALRLACGLRAAVDLGADLACVALGARSSLRAAVDEAVAEAVRRGVLVVAADPGDGAAPASSAGALPVGCLDGVDVALAGHRVVAEGRARPAPGYRRNFHGTSLSAARATAALARLAEGTGHRGHALLDGFSKALLVV